jgi:hypothetical protein
MAAIELAALADTIDMRLNNEHADRQGICEDVAARLRQIAAAAPATGVARDGCGGRLADALSVAVPAELAAHRTAAAAVLANYRREALDALSPGPELDWAPWAQTQVLTALLEEETPPLDATEQLLSDAIRDAPATGPTGRCSARVLGCGGCRGLAGPRHDRHRVPAALRPAVQARTALPREPREFSISEGWPPDWRPRVG